MARPSTQRVVTKKDREASRKGLDTGATIVVDGTEYTVRAGDLNALDEHALRQQYGCSYVELLGELAHRPGLDSIAALIWLSRRKDGERDLAYNAVAEGFRADSDFDVVTVGDQGAETNPEA